VVGRVAEVERDGAVGREDVLRADRAEGDARGGGDGGQRHRAAAADQARFRCTNSARSTSARSAATARCALA
jgi:hypothetical protein